MKSFITMLLPSTFWVASAAMLISLGSEARAAKELKASKVAAALSKNLELLKQWDTLPKDVQDVYAAAFNILGKQSKATFADVARDEAFQKLCVEKDVVHLGGPMLGSISSYGARVWLRTVRPAKVEVRVMVDGVEKSFGPVESTEETDLTAVVPVSGLKPGTRNPYRVLIDGESISIPDDSVIVTSPEDSMPGTARIAFGSCYHQWGLGNGKQAELLQIRRNNALLLLGDLAVQDRDAHVGLHRADYLLRDFFPAWQKLAASVPVYATWDDHDYFNNDESGVPDGYAKEDQAAVWQVFRRAWNNPSYGFGEEKKGVFLRTRVGPCDVIMTDDRYFRTGKKGSFLGEEQMQWLEAQLLDCRGPFILLSCGTMWSDYVSGGKDSWGVNDPAGRERIFSFIEKNRIGGVLLISGDRHGARGFRIPRPSGFEFYEFEAASLGGRHGPPAASKHWNTQLYGIDKTYAFGEFTFETKPSDPEVTFRLIREDGEAVYQQSLKRSQLTPPEK